MEVVDGLIKQCMEDNAATAMEQIEYAKRYDSLAERYETRFHKIMKQRINTLLQFAVSDLILSID